MKSVRFHQTGGPHVLIVEDVAEPAPGPGEILIRIEAIGVNFADVLRRRGDAYPEASPTPFTLGGEVAGTVEVLGEGVSGPAVGTAVFATPGQGGYAQYIVVPAERVIALPEGIDAAQATTLVVQGLTAALSLRDAGRLAPGERVLIEAAAGGVGTFAVQLAKLYGAGQVIAATSSAEKQAVALSLGADVAIDYTHSGWADHVREATDGHGADLVLEMVGGPTLGRALDTMSPFGRMVVYGLASGETALVDPQRLVNLNQTVTGFYIRGYFERPQLIERTLAEIVGFVQTGQLKLQVGARIPLTEAAEAHRQLEGRQTTGKIVLDPWA